MPILSDRTRYLKQSGIRAASTRCAAIGGINLGQGVCDLPVVDPIKTAAYEAILADKSQYSACEGVLALRRALAHKLATFNHLPTDPETELLVTHGSTGAFVCAVNTLFNPGDEVILFEPFYGYHKNILELYGIVVRTVPLNLQDFSFDPQDLSRVLTPRTKGIVVCTPNNPTGKVYSREELQLIGEFCREHSLFAITDEIYEYITYPGFEHVSLASMEDFRTHTVTISGFSKTYNMTGWRLGYATAPAAVIAKMALVQDLLYVCPATPLQHAVMAALALDETYYENMREQYLIKRDHVVAALSRHGFRVTVPQGAYYLLADLRDMGYGEDIEMVDFLLNEARVATVPGRAFYNNGTLGSSVIRVCYALRQEKIDQALRQIELALPAGELG